MLITRTTKAAGRVLRSMPASLAPSSLFLSLFLCLSPPCSAAMRRLRAESEEPQSDRATGAPCSVPAPGGVAADSTQSPDPDGSPGAGPGRKRTISRRRRRCSARNRGPGRGPGLSSPLSSAALWARRGAAPRVPRFPPAQRTTGGGARGVSPAASLPAAGSQPGADPRRMPRGQLAKGSGAATVGAAGSGLAPPRPPRAPVAEGGPVSAVRPAPLPGPGRAA